MAQHNSGESGWFHSRTRIALLAFLGIAGFFLVTEHRAHLFPVLPYLLLLACPLLHLWMHGRHGGHGKDTEDHAEDHPGHHEHTSEGKDK